MWFLLRMGKMYIKEDLLIKKIYIFKNRIFLLNIILYKIIPIMGFLIHLLDYKCIIKLL